MQTMVLYIRFPILVLKSIQILYFISEVNIILYIVRGREAHVLTGFHTVVKKVSLIYISIYAVISVFLLNKK